MNKVNIFQWGPLHRMLKLLDTLEKKMTDLSPLVESLEDNGYMVQARIIRDAMAQSVRKQKTGGRRKPGHHNASSSANIPAENAETNRVGEHEASSPSNPGTSKDSSQTEPPTLQLERLNRDQCIQADLDGNPSFMVKHWKK